MLELFKKKVEALTKTDAEIIEEIHESFNTEVDRLLEAAHITVSEDMSNPAIVTKHRRMASLGFTNTIQSDEAHKAVKKQRDAVSKNEEKKSVKEAILYFQEKYPLYKFITEASVKKICEKYGLVYGRAGRYKGFVPEANLTQIENFSIANEDHAYVLETMHRWGNPDNEFLHEEEYKHRQEHYEARLRSGSVSSFRKDFVGTASLEIAAPVKDFDMEDMEVKNFKLTKVAPPDPVVLCPVMHGSVKHYLIVTAWGDEASDPLVVNEKMN